jgi:4-hydroxy-4-methyl-2-oxoglutarate aldolase
MGEAGLRTPGISSPPPEEDRPMIQDPPLLTVRKSFARPSAAKVAKLAGAQTGHIVDALEGRGALDHRIKPIDEKRAQFVGVAFTCETGPSDNLAIMAAIALAKPGDVVVAASDGFDQTAVVGDNVCLMGKNAGLAAIVIDGMARDQDGIIEAGLPCFARGITPNSCVRSGPGRVGFPVVAGGVAVTSGDILVGDRDGVVVVPQDLLDMVLARLGEIRDAEQKVQAKIRSGVTKLDVITEILASERVRYVE